MAAGRVMFENLKIMIGNEMNEEYWNGSMEELRIMKESVDKAEDAVAAVERDKDGSISGGVQKLMALLYDADDLLDEIHIRCYKSPRLSRVAEDEDDTNNLEGENPLHRLVNASNRVVQKVGHCFSSSNQTAVPSSLARQVKKLGQEIDELMKQLRDKCRATNPMSESISDLPQQPYTLPKSIVIGRKAYKDEIIKRLLNPQGENGSSVSVTSIIGSSGVGKSALAELVYKDETIKHHFDLRIWIRVSQISHETEIIREIVESCTNRRSTYRQKHPKSAKFLHSRVPRIEEEGMFGDLLGCRGCAVSGIMTSYSASKSEIEAEKKEAKEKETEAYERKLRKEIKGKLYLLVLDDACITLGQGLTDILTAGARGSQILVTTRVEGAILAQTESVYHKLPGLSDGDSLSLFKTFAFGQEDNQEQEEDRPPEDPELKKIGDAIAKNCGGIPLTIKVAASCLYGKSKESWLDLNQQLMPHVTDEAHKLKHILNINYRNLPTRLKACFSYCSLFPDDITFNKHDLISLWIAQGFIDSGTADSLEANAEKCFRELSRRCFFEEVVTDDLRNNSVTCKMHHIMRSLACENSSTEIVSSYMTDSGINLDSTCKHVSFTNDRDSSMTISETMLQAQNLRTLVSVKEAYSNTKIDSLGFNKLISNSKCLRVLDLHDLGLEELPIFIKKLIHLRYLDLSQNDGLVTLPNSITQLYNLQTLKLNSCTKLQRIFGNFGELVNLRCLEVDDCDRLTSMPLGLEKLTQLQTLSRFVVGQDISKDWAANVGLKALKDLNCLKGRLAIEFTGDWTTAIPEYPQAELWNKRDLVELKISWAKTVLTSSNSKKKSNSLSEEEKSSYKLLLEKLQPNMGLKILSIEGYRGGDFPSWAGMETLATLTNLVVINIEGCDECKHLPPFGKLPSLKELTLRHMANVKYVQKDRFVYSSADDTTAATPTFFPCLEKLTLHNFYKLEGWWQEEMRVKSEVIPSFRRLEKLRIWNCPNLRSMPPFTKVSDLDLKNVNQALLIKSAKDISSNKVNSSSSRNSNSSSSRNISSLIRCYLNPLVWIGSSIKTANNQDISNDLKNLQIRGCSDLSSFETVRQGLGNLGSLQELVIESCHALTSLTSELSYLKALTKLEISYCNQLNLSEHGSSNMGNNSSMASPWTSLECLHRLILRKIPKMKSLPEGLKHVRTLKSLRISACTSLTELPKWIDQLTELQHLQIESCNAVTRLPDELQNVSSLMKVEITKCPELMKNCREHTGKDWHKIKHARVFLHKSWRHGLVPEIGASQVTEQI